MFTHLNYTAIAIISAVLGAVATILARTLLKDLRAKDILGVNFFTMAAVLVLLSPSFYHFGATPTAMALVALIALIDTAANYFFFKTFEQTEASIAAPILSLAPFFTFVVSWLFLDDHVAPGTLFVALAIILLIVLFSIDRRNFAEFKTATLFPALTSSVLFGISAVPSKYLLSTIGAINAPTLYMFRAGFIALFALLLFGFSVRPISIAQYRTMFIRSLFVIGQWILLYHALTRGNAGVTITLANITPVFVFLFGVLLLREKITLKKTLAATLVLVLSLLL